jgi:hypothetical protein
LEVIISPSYLNLMRVKCKEGTLVYQTKRRNAKFGPAPFLVMAL